MSYCFVIQPFDGGRFDKRFSDVFKPAIVAAGLEAYRVDRDPAVGIPINEIESGIKNAAICLADITLDNPNVWFELGYALASEKEIRLICSEERKSHFPFDVQHRSIIRYHVDSPSDYLSLQEKITARIKAVIEKTIKLAAVASKSPLREEGGLSQHEMIVLAAIVENREGPGRPVSHWVVKDELKRLGYNNIALNIEVEKLIKSGLLRVSQDEDRDGDIYNAYHVADRGLDWLFENSDRLELSVPKRISRPTAKANDTDLDEEIPF